MKNIHLLFYILCSFTPLFAQHSIVKIEPLALAASSISLHYEQVFNEQISVQIGGSISNKNIEYWDGLGGEVFAYSLSGQARYYFLPGYANQKAHAPEGMYVAAWGRYHYLRATMEIGGESAEMLQGASYSGGILGGFQVWLRHKKQNLLLLDAYMGTGYKIADYDGRFAERGKLIAYTSSGIVPRFGLALGVPF